MIDIYFYDSRFRCLYYRTFFLGCTTYPAVQIHVFSPHSAIKHQPINLFSLCPISFCSCTSVTTSRHHHLFLSLSMFLLKKHLSRFIFSFCFLLLKQHSYTHRKESKRNKGILFYYIIDTRITCGCDETDAVLCVIQKGSISLHHTTMYIQDGK